MKKLILALVFLVWFVPAHAQQEVCITIPQPMVAPLLDLCGDLQAHLKVKTLTPQQCVRWFTRFGVREMKRRLRKIELQENLGTTINSELNQIETDFPTGLVEAVCGDGEIDAITNETCDDGNTVPGDGCSAVCQVE